MDENELKIGDRVMSRYGHFIGIGTITNIATEAFSPMEYVVEHKTTYFIELDCNKNFPPENRCSKNYGSSSIVKITKEVERLLYLLEASNNPHDLYQFELGDAVYVRTNIFDVWPTGLVLSRTFDIYGRAFYCVKQESCDNKFRWYGASELSKYNNPLLGKLTVENSIASLKTSPTLYAVAELFLIPGTDIYATDMKNTWYFGEDTGEAVKYMEHMVDSMEYEPLFKNVINQMDILTGVVPVIVGRNKENNKIFAVLKIEDIIKIEKAYEQYQKQSLCIRCNGAGVVMELSESLLETSIVPCPVCKGQHKGKK
jgi:hypothetical protein